MRITGVIMFLLSVCCQAQQTPQPFEPQIISDGGVFGFTLSADSKTALWVKSKGKRDTLVIVESKKIKGKWSKAVRASFSSDGQWKDIDPIFCPNGTTVLFQSNRAVPGMPDRKGFDIWAVEKSKNGWGEPYHLGNSINKDTSESYASMSEDGSIYFMKDNENQACNSDLYVSRLENGQYQEPLNLGSPINTQAYRESNPFVSAKGDYLIYFSSDPGGFGDVDLFISFKTDDGWSAPQNLGRPINSEKAEFCPFVHQGKLYFSRQYKQADRMIEDIFVVDFDAEAFRPVEKKH